MKNGKMKTNYLICPGEACPLRLTCIRFHRWLDNDDENAEEMEPAFRDGVCDKFIMKEYYGG